MKGEIDMEHNNDGLEVGGGFVACMALMLFGLGYILGTL